MGTLAGHPENQAWPKNDPKKSIRLLFGAPGHSPRAQKSINGPHGQKALKKQFVHENLVRNRLAWEGRNLRFTLVFPIESRFGSFSKQNIKSMNICSPKIIPKSCFLNLKAVPRPSGGRRGPFAIGFGCHSLTDRFLIVFGIPPGEHKIGKVRSTGR